MTGASKSNEGIQELDEFIASCAPGMVFFDVGAQFGAYSLTALHYGSPGASVVAFEPSRSAAKLMKRCLQFNYTGADLKIVEAAVGSHTGQLSLGRTVYMMYEVDASRPSVHVPMISLDDFCSQGRALPTHLKIDVEGYEEMVLRGADNSNGR